MTYFHYGVMAFGLTLLLGVAGLTLSHRLEQIEPLPGSSASLDANAGSLNDWLNLACGGPACWSVE